MSAVRGALAAAEQLDAFATELTERARALAGAHAASVADRARALAPVDTGALRDSIAVKELDEDAFAVVAGAPYAATVELGSFTTAPRPFLGTAAREEGRA